MHMEMPYKDAAELLDFLAVRTWDNLTDAYELQLSISEESITDFNLLEIRRSNLKNVAVTKFSKLHETKNGADWDLWIGSNSSGWLRYLIQAKKLDIEPGNYKSLRQWHLNEQKKKIWQIEQLHNFALQERAIPAYCFYNGGDELRQRGSPLAGAHGANIDKTYGCSISSYKVVRDRHDSPRHRSKTFASLHPRRYSFPWSELVQCHYDWTRYSSSLDNHPLIGRQASAQNVGPKIFLTLPESVRQIVGLSIESDIRDHVEGIMTRYAQKDSESTSTGVLRFLEECQESDFESAMSEYPGLLPKRIGVIEIENDSRRAQVPTRR